MAISQITASQLTKRLEAHPSPVLLDVNDADAFAAQHLPGAVNASVYEMAFLDHVKDKLGLQPSQPVIVYGTDARSYASRVAAQKLAAAGFAEVEEFRGGLEAAREAGLPLEGDTKAAQSPASAQGQLQVDAGQSEVRWIGRNLANQHRGLMPIQSGYVNLVDGVLKGGELVFDLEALSCEDIEDDKANKMLLQHFRDWEFFNIGEHPTAKVQLEHVAHDPLAPVGSPNYEVAASLTLRGVTAPVRGRLVGGCKDGSTWACQGTVEFDRTRWNVIYGSGKFFTGLGMHAVNDLITVDLRLIFGGKR
ncbi:MAG: YceI family protein [Verrucomicrobiota bacterium JB022]|nr:YceI family protein [Verrucomicrobiota bacterium JB022]